MHESLMATKDSEILPAENAHYSSSDVSELVSTMDPNSLAATLSVYLEPREPFPVFGPEPGPESCSNADRPNMIKTDALIDPYSIVLTESSDLRDTHGKDPGNKVIENKHSSNRRSTRKSSSKQKNNTKLAARKSRKKSGKKPMVDLLAADVGRGQRSSLVRRVRPSSWGFGGKIDEIFKHNAEKNGDVKGRMSLKGGKKNNDSVNKRIQNTEGESRPSSKGLLLKLKLGKTAVQVQTCQFNTIPDMEKDLESYGVVKLEASSMQSNIKGNYEKEVYRASSENLDKGIASLKSPINDVLLAEGGQIENRCVDPGTSPDSEVINVIPDAQINGNITQDVRVSSKDCILHHSDDCGVASGIPSPEIVNDVISCEKQTEGPSRSVAFFHQTEVKGSMDMLTAERDLKAEDIIDGIKSIESRSNGQHLQISLKSKSSVNKDITNCHEKASPANSTVKENIKEKSDTETYLATGVVETNDARGVEEGSRSTGGVLPNSTVAPRSAWVCCDDCHKWRRIAASLADAIEATECRWICKDNADKDFADCSIPQEKSNADINQELDLSDCEDDAGNNTRVNSSQLAQKQPTDLPQPSWKLIKTNMFLHRNRKNQSIDEVMVCHCKPSVDGHTGCRDECLNRMLNIECVKGTCPCGDLCSNQQFQRRKYSKLKCFPSGKKGYGLQLQEDIPKGRFLIEYVGEVLDMPAYEARQKEYAKKGHKHFYFMTLNGSEVIDACAKGNLGRFINHSCEPNCRTEKWMVNGEVCIGLFAIRDINKGEELTFDYNYVRVFGAAAKRCVCGSSRCRGVIGGDPLNDETVVLGDSDDEYPPPVAFYENNNNKLDNAVSATVTAESNIINDIESNQSPDSLFYPNEKNDDLATLAESTEREIFLERSSSATSASECKTEDTEGPFPSVQLCDTSFKLKSGLEEQNEVDLLPEDSDSKKKPKSHMNAKKCTILKPKARSKVKSPPTAVKKGKSKSKQTETDTKPLVAPQKPKKIVVDNLNGRFEAVEEALNSLLTKGGISKRRDASKGYLTLLCLTANGGNGEGIQSNRDLSMILDALLRTKSRTVLLDIINKNGLQMLHILLKRYRKVFNKTPILRKLLKVLEYLAEIKILTVHNILRSSLPGVESFKESILSLTEHADKEVHQIARNFRDRYIPWYARRVNRAERETDRKVFQQDTDRKVFQQDTDRKVFQQNSNLKSFPLQQRKPSEVAENPTKQSVTPVEGPSASSLSSCTDGTQTQTQTRVRKRKSRWDEPGDVLPDMQSPSKQEFKSNTGPSNMDVDAPPGFCPPSTATHHCKTATGQPQDRYVSRLPTAFGLPCSLLKKLGTPNGDGAPAKSWVVAPGMTFHPFPPLPSYPRGENRHPKEEPWRNGHFQREDRNPNTLGRRYFKQQKWNYPRSGGGPGQQWNPHKYGPAGFSGPNPNPNPNPNPDPNQQNFGFGYGRNEADGTYNTGNSYYHHHHPPPPYH